MSKVSFTFDNIAGVDDAGFPKAATIKFRVLMEVDGGGEEEVLNESLTGRSTSPYHREYDFNIPYPAETA